MDRFDALRTFVAVVEAGSFSAAARRLGQGQSAVSKQIAQLEGHLGAALLVRTTRALTLTDAGELLLDRARAALDAVEDAESAVRQSGQALSGRLRVCAPVTFARLHIVPRLPAFLAAHPSLELDLVLDDRRIDLVEEGIDLAVRAGPLTDSSLVARRLGTTDRVLVATPRYWDQVGRPATPSDLSALRFIVYANAGDWVMGQPGRTHLLRLDPALKVNAVEGQREAVLAHLGPTIASRWVFWPELARGVIEAVLTDWHLPEVELYAVFPAGRRVNARARAFEAFLQSLLADLATPA
jgi:DNA-binding transcriptional LysR family regulator